MYARVYVRMWYFIFPYTDQNCRLICELLEDSILSAQMRWNAFNELHNKPILIYEYEDINAAIYM